ncbi:MAG: flippase, partial [Chloroflexota bacterium]
AAPRGSAQPSPAGGARRVARNSLLPFVANLLGRGMALGLAAIMARTLGAEGTGAYAVAVNLWLYASIVADFGLGTWLTREVARAPTTARDVLCDTLGLRLILSALALPVLILAAVAAGYVQSGMADWRLVATVTLLGVGLLPGAVSAAGSALFNAHERMTFPAAVQLASAALTTTGGAAVLLLGFDIVALGWVSLLVNGATAAIFTVASARHFFPLGVAFHRRRQTALARDALPLMLNSLLNNVFFRFDVQVLQSKGSAAVGYYANAYRVIDAAGAVPSSFVLALFPLLSRRAAAASATNTDGHGRAGAEGLARVYCLALKLLMVVALPLALMVTFAAVDLTRWAWGAAFLPDSAIALQILIWFLPLSFFNGLTQYVLIALGLQRRITIAFALAAGFNVAANLVLIPLYGYVAAAAVTIASEVVLLGPFLLALRERVPVASAIRAALRPLPAALGLGLALWAPAPWPRPAAILVGGVLFASLLVVTGVFDRSERRVLMSLVKT